MKLRISGLLAIAVAFALAPGHARADTPTLTTLVNFDGTNGIAADPEAGLIADANGNLFGTTVFGGTGSYDGLPGNFGTVFEVAKTASGYTSTPIVLYNFCSLNFECLDGKYPEAGLLADANGDLFGTTVSGGEPLISGGDVGTVFEISKTGGLINILDVFEFFPADFARGYAPQAGLVADANGNLFGTTSEGGNPSCNSPYGCGTVFEIVKTANGYAPITLVSFNDGASPGRAGLILDANGNLFGTTAGGGAFSNGTVFEIVNNGTSRAPSYASTPISLVSFNGTDGASPSPGLILDANGNLFGTTAGGGAISNGTVFEIVNNGTSTAPSYASTTITLVSFNGTDGASPIAGLILDANGNLFGTTAGGGAYGGGTVFEIARTASGYASRPTILYNFCAQANCTDGAGPGGIIADANGNLFGTTGVGGAYGYGTVFEITGTGFIPPGVLAGTPGQATCIGQTVSGLAQKFGTLLNAATALDYSVRDLQNEVVIYCGGYGKRITPA
jgi:uncharacterized repeat protein (TIGR03803 family)